MEQILSIYLSSNGVSTDTRKIEKGNIFFALKGENFNGNLFAAEALDKGAGYVVVDEYHNLNKNDDRVIKVDNVLEELQHLASEYRKYLGITVLSLTGSNGKTTSKELIASVLSKKYNINFTKGNLNNEIGVPLTILSTNAEHDFLLVEMGANHQGEIALLSEISQPNYGFITNIGKAHLEGFGGIEGVKKGKTELYRYLEKSGGFVFLNTADDVLTSLAPNERRIEFTSHDFEIISEFPCISLRYKPSNIEFKTNLAGTYNLSNIAAAFAIGKYFNINENDIVEAISNYSPSNNRSQLDLYKGVRIIKDAYNSNPSSLSSSLSSLFTNTASDKVVILGDMLELGEYSSQEHKTILDMLLKAQPAMAILVGPNFGEFKDKYPFNFFENVEEARNFINWESLKDKSVLIKGSRGLALERILED